MFARYQAKAAWPVSHFSNVKFWDFVYKNNKQQQVEDCLKSMEFKFPCRGYLYDTVSPAPYLLVQELFRKHVFSIKALYELADIISYTEDTKKDFLSTIPHNIKAVWPVNDYDNDLFWNFVYKKNKQKPVHDCLNQMEYNIYSITTFNNIAYRVSSPEPRLLVENLFQRNIFSNSELQEMAVICITQETRTEFLKYIPSFYRGLENGNGPNDPNDPNGPNGPNNSSPYYGQPPKTNCMVYLMITLGVLIIAASFKLHMMAAIATALAGGTVIAVSLYSMKP